MELSKSTLFSFTSFNMSSPKSVFCQANHGRVKFAASWREKDSCMKPVPASVVIRATMQSRISASSSDVKARIMMLMGQIISTPIWAPPMPSPAEPLQK